MQKLKETVIAQHQSDVNNIKYDLVGMLEQHLLDVIPVASIAPSALCLLLGIGNKLMSSFFSCCHERFETITRVEIETETSCIIAELDNE